MPPNKKKASSKKKGKGKKQRNAAAESASKSTPDPPSATIDSSEEQRGSIAAADALAALCAADYPPTIDVEDYLDGLPRKAEMKALQSYNACSDAFNRGLRRTDQVSANPGPTSSRWHLAESEYLDAVDAAMKSRDAFLKTTGSDHRNLLCKALLSIAQCRGRLVDSDGMVAWARAAIAADPTYYNGYSQLSLGLQHQCEWEQSLEAARRALAAEGSERAPRIPFRIDLLERIVEAKPNSKKRKEAIRAVLADKRGIAMRCWQETNVPRPANSCQMCSWPAETRCSRCRVVRYCSRHCQAADYPTHKLNCVAVASSSAGDDGTDAAAKKKSYPEPDYPRNEWIDDENWAAFQRLSKVRGTNIVHTAVNNCHTGAVKRALMEEGGMDMVNSLEKNEYPIHRVATRAEPDEAVDIVGLLLKHGACPQVLRCDGKHLLEVCRGRARWIDDAEPSMMNEMFRMPYLIQGQEALEDAEREESAELVNIVTEAIRNHTMCEHCEAQRALAVDFNSRGMPNLTDQMMRMFEREKTEGVDPSLLTSALLKGP